MAVRGQRFELDLDADDFVVNPITASPPKPSTGLDIVKDIQEHESPDIPPAPRIKSSNTGFPNPRFRPNTSQSNKQERSVGTNLTNQAGIAREPSDRAIAHQLAKNQGYDFDEKQKADISRENKDRISAMSINDIEDARAELLRNLSPTFIERLLKRANIDDDTPGPSPVEEEYSTSENALRSNSDGVQGTAPEVQTPTSTDTSNEILQEPSIHFPVPPRRPEDYRPLDPSSETFLEDLRTHYFPETPHDPSSLSWLQDPTPDENADSSYNPEKDSYAPSSLRFGFNGRLIPPKESLDISANAGLHHHGEAASSAGYTIPELAILSRSVLPNQRCIAYQTLGRILYRLGTGDFGPRGTELQEGLWNLIEKERALEVIMAEANRENGHVSAQAYATEALWLWRKGGGGDRGLLKNTERLAK